MKNGQLSPSNAIMEPRISIIVPIYNVERYIRKCLDSLLSQDLTFEEYEVIIVDDGSPDGCPEICDYYASQYRNIKVIHQKNGGLGAARNRGLRIAKGKYIQFVDSDDFLEPNVLGTLIQKVEKDDLDVLRFNYQNVNEQYLLVEPNKESRPYMDYCDEVCNGLTFLTERLGYGCYAWQFLIRRELMDNCLFMEDIFFEDTEWTPRLLRKAQKVTSIDRLVYNYLTREGSITRSIDEMKKRKLLTDKLLIIDLMKMQMRNVQDKRWFEGMMTQMALSVIDDVSNSFYGEKWFFLDKLNSKGVFPLSAFHATATAQRKIRWANVSPVLLCSFLHLKNR